MADAFRYAYPPPFSLGFDNERGKGSGSDATYLCNPTPDLIAAVWPDPAGEGFNVNLYLEKGTDVGATVSRNRAIPHHASVAVDSHLFAQAMIFHLVERYRALTIKP